MILSYCHAWLSPACYNNYITIRDDHVASYNIVSQNQPLFLWIACPSWAESTLFEGKEATLGQTKTIINNGSYSSLTITVISQWKRRGLLEGMIARLIAMQ